MGEKNNDSLLNLAMIGPGYGHNIQPFLSMINEMNNVRLVFFFHGKDQFSKNYQNIDFKKITSFDGVYTLMARIRKFDLLWQMSGGKFLYFLPFLFPFMQKNSKSVLHVWGERLPRSTNNGTLQSSITTFFVRKFDYINCNWFGTANLFNEKIKNKVKVNPIGLTNEYYTEDESPSREMQTIIEDLPKNTYKFFYPKSFFSVSRHDLVVEAIRLLRTNGVDNFMVYFWEGNGADPERRKEIIDMIESYSLEPYVQVMKKDRFYSYSDLNYLWKEMDCGLQIAQNDQLSNTIFEPMINIKDIVITDIPPYHHIEQFFGFSLPLTPLTETAIYLAMKGMIEGSLRIEQKEKVMRATRIKELYVFEEQFPKVLSAVAEA